MEREKASNVFEKFSEIKRQKVCGKKTEKLFKKFLGNFPNEKLGVVKLFGKAKGLWGFNSNSRLQR